MLTHIRTYTHNYTDTFAQTGTRTHIHICNITYICERDREGGVKQKDRDVYAHVLKHYLSIKAHISVCKYTIYMYTCMRA